MRQVPLQWAGLGLVMSGDGKGARRAVEVGVVLMSVVVCLGPSLLGLGGEWVGVFQVMFGPLPGCLRDSVVIVRGGGGPGERLWEGFLGPGSICDPQFVGFCGSIGVGGSRWRVGIGLIERDQLLGHVHLRILGA